MKLLLLLIPLLAGCTLFDGRGSDGSQLRVVHDCDVKLDQKAVVSGMDDSDTIERVRVNPDCTTEIDFQQAVGDSGGTTGQFKPVDSVELVPPAMNETGDGVDGTGSPDGGGE